MSENDGNKGCSRGCAVVTGVSVAIVVFLLVAFPDKKETPDKRQEAVTHAQFAFTAAGCGVITRNDAEAIMGVALHNARNEDRAAGRPEETSESAYAMARLNGLSYSQTSGACSVWKNNPLMVDLLRTEANIARAQLSEAGSR